jgi:hypothetical protein
MIGYSNKYAEFFLKFVGMQNIWQLARSVDHYAPWLLWWARWNA